MVWSRESVRFGMTPAGNQLEIDLLAVDEVEIDPEHLEIFRSGKNLRTVPARVSLASLVATTS